MSNNHDYLYDLAIKAGLSDFGARTVRFVVERPLKILLLVLLAWLVSRLGARTVSRFVRSLARRAPARLSSSARSDLRTETLAHVMARLFRLVVGVVAGLLIIGVLGVNLTPLLAGAGIVGIAVGLGTQSLVRDMVAGLFIVGEDQYGVGDIIDINGWASGVVEDVNLRSTRMRANDGTVWFIPNGQIQRVGNSSMEFSRALVDVPLTYGVDLAQVEVVAAEEADAMADAPEWSGRVLEPPEVWGIQSLDPTGPTLRLVVKTVPLADGPVGRELRRRVVDRLTREGLRTASA
jgi:small-conductance mechanosensitive channel